MQLVPQILQLFPNLELYRDGEPGHNTLFVLGRDLAPPLGAGDELLLVDPPEDARTRFTLPERVVAIATVGSAPNGFATLATEPGGVAHLRIGDHMVDLHAFAGRTVVYLPAVGMICGGGFGQKEEPPRLQQRTAHGQVGDDELAVLRFLARTVRERRVQLYVPLVGEPERDIMAIMSALAEDVGYIHALRRNVAAIARTGDGLNAALALGETILPPQWRSPQAKAIHAANVNALYSDATYQQN